MDRSAYLGMDAKDAEARLRGLGLSVKKQSVDGRGQKDTVADVTPSGRVPQDSEVTLSVWRGPRKDGDHGKGHDASHREKGGG